MYQQQLQRPNASEFFNNIGSKEPQKASAASLFNTGFRQNAPLNNQFTQNQFGSFVNETAPQQNAPSSLPPTPMAGPPIQSAIQQTSGPSSLDSDSVNPFRWKSSSKHNSGQKNYATAQALFPAPSLSGNDVFTPAALAPITTSADMSMPPAPFNSPPSVPASSNYLPIVQPPEYVSEQDKEVSCSVNMIMAANISALSSKDPDDDPDDSVAPWEEKCNPIGKKFSEYRRTEISEERRKQLEHENDLLRAEKAKNRDKILAEKREQVLARQKENWEKVRKEKEQAALLSSFQNDDQPLTLAQKPKTKEERKQVKEQLKRARARRQELGQHHDAGNLGSLIDEISSQGASICSDLSDIHHFEADNAGTFVLNDSYNNAIILPTSSSHSSLPANDHDQGHVSQPGVTTFDGSYNMVSQPTASSLISTSANSGRQSASLPSIPQQLNGENGDDTIQPGAITLPAMNGALSASTGEDHGMISQPTVPTFFQSDTNGYNNILQPNASLIFNHVASVSETQTTDKPQPASVLFMPSIDSGQESMTANPQNQCSSDSSSGSSYVVAQKPDCDSRLSPYQLIDNETYPSQSSLYSNDSSPLEFVQNISTASSSYEKVTMPQSSSSLCGTNIQSDNNILQGKDNALQRVQVASPNASNEGEVSHIENQSELFTYVPHLSSEPSQAEEHHDGQQQNSSEIAVDHVKVKEQAIYQPPVQTGPPPEMGLYAYGSNQQIQSADASKGQERQPASLSSSEFLPPFSMQDSGFISQPSGTQQSLILQTEAHSGQQAQPPVMQDSQPSTSVSQQSMAELPSQSTSHQGAFYQPPDQQGMQQPPNPQYPTYNSKALYAYGSDQQIQPTSGSIGQESQPAVLSSSEILPPSSMQDSGFISQPSGIQQSLILQTEAHCGQQAQPPVVQHSQLSTPVSQRLMTEIPSQSTIHQSAFYHPLEQHGMQQLPYPQYSNALHAHGSNQQIQPTGASIGLDSQPAVLSSSSGIQQSLISQTEAQSGQPAQAPVMQRSQPSTPVSQRLMTELPSQSTSHQSAFYQPLDQQGMQQPPYPQYSNALHAHGSNQQIQSTDASIGLDSQPAVLSSSSGAQQSLISQTEAHSGQETQLPVMQHSQPSTPVSQQSMTEFPSQSTIHQGAFYQPPEQQGMQQPPYPQYSKGIYTHGSNQQIQPTAASIGLDSQPAVLSSSSGTRQSLISQTEARSEQPAQAPVMQHIQPSTPVSQQPMTELPSQSTSHQGAFYEPLEQQGAQQPPYPQYSKALYAHGTNQQIQPTGAIIGQDSQPAVLSSSEVLPPSSMQDSAFIPQPSGTQQSLISQTKAQSGQQAQPSVMQHIQPSTPVSQQSMTELPSQSTSHHGAFYQPPEQQGMQQPPYPQYSQQYNSEMPPTFDANYGAANYNEMQQYQYWQYQQQQMWYANYYNQQYYNQYPGSYGYPSYDQYYDQYSYHSSAASSTYGDSRPGSVIERRSSGTDDQVLSELADLTSELSFQNRAETPPAQEIIQRSTPLSFTRPHVKACFANFGGVINVVAPKQPLDGETGSVQNIMLHAIVPAKMLMRFPGPLVRKETHKKHVRNFIAETIRDHLPSRYTDPNQLFSHTALWSFVDLIVRQNGTYDGSDVADLLIGLLPTVDVGGRESKQLCSLAHPPSVPSHETQEEFLMFMSTGRSKDGLDVAIRSGMWGHAFMMGHTLGDKWLSHVQSRFLQSLKKTDPMKILYDHLQNKDTSFVKKRASLDHWVQNLCMLVSQTSGHAEKDQENIVAFGDVLREQGLYAAAQLCYLIANVPFGKHSSKEDRLVLLGFEHRNYTEKPAHLISQDLYVQLTEVYQYACTLHDRSFIISNFQPYKFEYALQLLEYGCSSEGLAYLESISMAICNDQTFSLYSTDFIRNIIKYAEQVLLQDVDKYEEIEETPWIKNLKRYCEKAANAPVPSFTNIASVESITNVSSSRTASSQETSDEISTSRSSSGLPTHRSSTSQHEFQNNNTYVDNECTSENNEQIEYVTNEYLPAQTESNETTFYEYNNQYTDNAYVPDSNVPNEYTNNEYVGEQTNINQSNAPAQYDYNDQYANRGDMDIPDFAPNTYQPNGMYQPELYQPDASQAETYQPDDSYLQHQTNYDNAPFGYGQQQQPDYQPGHNEMVAQEEANEEEDLFSNFSKSKNNQNQEQSNEKATKPTAAETSKNTDSKQSKGWFGGIFSKFSRPKAHLPDDTDKALVYDENLKKWVDRNADPEETKAPLAPPPMGDFGTSPAAYNSQPPGLAPTNQPPGPPLAEQPPKSQPPGLPTGPYGMPTAPTQTSSGHMNMVPNLSQPHVIPNNVASPMTQTMNRAPEQSVQSRNRGRLAQKKMSSESPAAKQEEEEKKPPGPPSKFSLKAQGGRRGLNRYVNVMGSATKATPMTPVLDPFAGLSTTPSKGNSSSDTGANSNAPPTFFDPSKVANQVPSSNTHGRNQR